MKLRRDVAVTPQQTGAEAWAQIVGLVTRSDSVDKSQLDAASSVMATLLAEDHYAEHPLTLKGQGPRVVIYGIYGGDALSTGEPDPLLQNPTAGEWTLYVPCSDEDITWVQNILAGRAPRVRVHDLEETPGALVETTTAASPEVSVDWGALR